MQRIDLEKAHWKELEHASIDMVILPWGATEPHNRHLPYGTDSLCSRAVALEALSLISEDCPLSIAVLPVMPFGVNTGQRDLNLCMSIRPSVQYRLLEEIALNLGEQKIPKLMIVNGHGGNNLKPLLRELQQKVPEVFCCFTNWWTLKDGEDYFTEPGDHAGELETSTMQYLYPELVLPLSEAGDGSSTTFKPSGLSNRAVWAPRSWSKVSSDTGVGDPVASSASKGERFFNDSAKVLAEYIADIAATDNADLYG